MPPCKPTTLHALQHALKTGRTGDLPSIFDGDTELISFVQRAIGYSMTGSTREQCFFICWGDGANGKSTLLETLRKVLGDYAQTSSSDTLMVSRNGRGPENDLARLRGARLVAAAESGETRQLDEERIKRITGGDTITARFLYREHFEFSPQLKLWLAANDRPEIRGIDHGIWRRIRLIPFTITIPVAEQDRELPAKLAAEAEGILRWAVTGCLAWQRDGLGAPAAVVEAGAEWRAEANTVAQFVDDVCVREAGVHVVKATLYGAYIKWSEAQGLEAMSQIMFGKRLVALGCAAGRNHAGRTWVGIRLAGPAGRVA